MIIPGTLASMWRHLCPPSSVPWWSQFQWPLSLFSLILSAISCDWLLHGGWTQNCLSLRFQNLWPTAPSSPITIPKPVYCLPTLLLLWSILLGLLCSDSLPCQDEGSPFFLIEACHPFLEQKNGHLEGCLLLAKQHAKRHWNQQPQRILSLKKNKTKKLFLLCVWNLVAMMIFWKDFLLFTQMSKVRRMHTVSWYYKAAYSLRRQIMRMWPNPGKLAVADSGHWRAKELDFGLFLAHMTSFQGECQSFMTVITTYHWDWEVCTQQKFIFTVLDDVSPKLGCQHGQVLVKALFQIADCWLLAVPSHGGRCKYCLWGLLT